jgi:hypothetical protein
VRQGRIGPHAAMKYLVPLARANADDCLRLTEAIAEPVSSRQVATLYAGYKSADSETRDRIIGDPQLYLRAQESACGEAEKAELPPDRVLLSDLEIIAAVARRIKRHFEQGLAKNLSAAQRGVVLGAMAHARHNADKCFTRCEQELRHAGSSDTNEHPTTQA